MQRLPYFGVIIINKSQQNQKMKLQTISIFVSLLLATILLVACEPNEKQRAAAVEAKRIECLDKICTGDIVPKHDYTKDAILKLNGQWFIGPEEFFPAAVLMSF